MNVGNAFGLGFALSVVVFILLCAIFPSSSSFIDFAAGFGFSIDQKGAGAMALTFGFIFPALAFFGTPIVNQVVIGAVANARERERTEYERLQEENKRKLEQWEKEEFERRNRERWEALRKSASRYFDTPLARELGREVASRFSQRVEGASRSASCKTYEEEIHVTKYVGCNMCALYFGDTLGMSDSKLLFNGKEERVSFSDPRSFAAAICFIAQSLLRKKYRVDPSGGEIVSLEISEMSNWGVSKGVHAFAIDYRAKKRMLCRAGCDLIRGSALEPLN